MPEESCSSAMDAVGIGLPEYAGPVTTPAEIVRSLANFKLFGDLEVGPLHRLAATVKPAFCPAGTVLFRQGDPPGCCYAIRSGETAVFCMTEEETLADLTYRLTCASADGSPKLGLSMLPGRLTMDGFSKHHDEQRLGAKIAALSAGQLVGELALLNDQPRSASVQCTADCEFLVIPRNDFEDVLKEEMFRKGDAKLKFLVDHMPGMRDSPAPKPGGAKLHASYYFRKARFPGNHVFFRQGEVGEAAIYIVIRGAVEFSRCNTKSTEGLLPHPFEYGERLLGRPQSLPGLGISMGGPAAIAAASCGAWSRTPGSKSRLLGGKLNRHALSSSSPDVAIGEPGGGILSRCGVLLSGGVFGSMPAGEAEIFTVKSTTASCEVYYITAADFPKLPRRLVDTMRDYVASTMVWRLQNHESSNKLRNVLEGKRLVTGARGLPPPPRKQLPREPPDASRVGLVRAIV